MLLRHMTFTYPTMKKLKKRHGGNNNSTANGRHNSATNSEKQKPSCFLKFLILFGISFYLILFREVLLFFPCRSNVIVLMWLFHFRWARWCISVSFVSLAYTILKRTITVMEDSTEPWKTLKHSRTHKQFWLLRSGCSVLFFIFYFSFLLSLLNFQCLKSLADMRTHSFYERRYVVDWRGWGGSLVRQLLCMRLYLFQLMTQSEWRNVTRIITIQQEIFRYADLLSSFLHAHMNK